MQLRVLLRQLLQEGNVVRVCRGQGALRTKDCAHVLDSVGDLAVAVAGERAVGDGKHPTDLVARVLELHRGHLGVVGRASKVAEGHPSLGALGVQVRIGRFDDVELVEQIDCR